MLIDVPQQEVTGVHPQIVEPVILTGDGEWVGFAVDMNHALGSAGQSSHAEASGEGEQIEDSATAGVLAEPTARRTRVEEEPTMLAGVYRYPEA